MEIFLIVLFVWLMLLIAMSVDKNAKPHKDEIPANFYIELVGEEHQRMILAFREGDNKFICQASHEIALYDQLEALFPGQEIIIRLGDWPPVKLKSIKELAKSTNPSIVEKSHF